MISLRSERHVSGYIYPRRLDTRRVSPPNYAHNYLFKRSGLARALSHQAVAGNFRKDKEKPPEKPGAVEGWLRTESQRETLRPTFRRDVARVAGTQCTAPAQGTLSVGCIRCQQ